MIPTNHPRELRLLSPTHRRIVSIDRGNDGHALTLGQLIHFGWNVYRGPALTDANGWVIPGTDPNVVPRPALVRVIPTRRPA